MTIEQPGATAARIEESRFTTRVFYVFLTLALLSLAVTVAGRHFGRVIIMAGNTDDSTVHRIAIGDEILALPANMIRFEKERRDGAMDRVDLYVHWPDMTGYSADTREDFDNRSGVRRILFLTITPREMSRGMSARYGPIYRNLIELPGKPGPEGLTFYRFRPQSGYLKERLAVADRPGRATPFVARCLSPATTEASFADCERDIQFGRNLQLRYRFPSELLARWSAIDRAMATFARQHLVANGG